MNRIHLTLLVTTALVVPSLSSAQTVETACNDLGELLIVGLPDGAGDQDDLITIVNEGDGEACLVELTRVVEMTDTDEATVADTAQTTVTLQDEVTVGGRVLLDQSPPRVDVQEGATDVEIDPGNPTIDVVENAGEIVVRQAPATITVDMPAPTIRIEQAAPQIIITMPDPDVTVGNAQPTVRVVQADPIISVTQAPPGVELELSRIAEGEEGGFDISDQRTGQSYRAGSAPEEMTTDDAEVTITKAEPKVIMTEPAGEATVNIERAQPDVRVEQAEPTVNFNMADPTVEFTQSGEAIVTFEQASMEEDTDAAAMTDTAAMDESDAEETDMADENITPMTDEVDAEAAETGLVVTDGDMDATETANTDAPMTVAGPEIERDGYTLATLSDTEADTLIGTNLYGINDEDIGEIGDLVVGSDGAIESVIVEVGGFLGLGEKDVRLPFERLSILRSEDGDIRSYIDSTEEELESMPEN